MLFSVCCFPPKAGPLVYYGCFKVTFILMLFLRHWKCLLMLSQIMQPSSQISFLHIATTKGKYQGRVTLENKVGKMYTPK